MEQQRVGTQQSSSTTESLPWPNTTTSMTDSSLISSKVIYNDIDGDFKQEAVFFSRTRQGAAASQVLRVVRSGDFTERVNLRGLRTAADASIGMLLTDIDMSNGNKELLYISDDRRYIVALVIVAPGAGSERFRYALKQPLATGQLLTLVERNQGNDKLITIGNNIIRINKLTGVQVESAFDRINGGWSGFSDWGAACSKSCGDGIANQIRLCNSPSPRNGGAYCSGAAVRTKTCRVRACTAQDCRSNERLENGSCVADTSNSSGGGSSSGGGNSNGSNNGGGSSAGSNNGGGTSTATCPQGLVWFEAFQQCYVPHSYDDIWLFHSIRTGGGREEAPTYEEYTLRLSLSHEKASGLNAQQTADRYCYYKGHDGSISHTTEFYRAGQNNYSLRAFITCDIVSNGLYFNQGGCPVGNDRGVSYTMTNIFHQNDEQVQYLKSVICRKNNEGVQPNRQ